MRKTASKEVFIKTPGSVNTQNFFNHKPLRARNSTRKEKIIKIKKSDLRMTRSLFKAGIFAILTTLFFQLRLVTMTKRN
jgi:hypothetical protein